MRNYQSEHRDEAAAEKLQDLPQLSMIEKELMGFLTFAELPSAMQGLNSGRSPGLDGLSSTRVFDLYHVFMESFNQGVLPLRCRRAVLTLIPRKGDLGYLKVY